MEAYSLLERYRLDRRKLLEFILSSGLVREIRTPSGSSASISDVNLDFISADYVLQSIKSGNNLSFLLFSLAFMFISSSLFFLIFLVCMDLFE